jgi:hypothetical protein
MRIMEQARGDKVPPVLEPVAVGREAGSPRSSFGPESSRPPFRRAVSWLATTMIESFAACAGMSPTVVVPSETHEGTGPNLQSRRQAETICDPAWSRRDQPSSFNDWLSMEKVSTASLGGAPESDPASSASGQPYAESGRCGGQLPKGGARRSHTEGHRNSSLSNRKRREVWKFPRVTDPRPQEPTHAQGPLGRRILVVPSQ